jgi:hypothetical protein
MKFLSVLAASAQGRARRFFLCAALAFASALSGAVGLGFATYALFEAWRLQYGSVNAALGLSAIYIILAAILYLCCLRVGANRRGVVNSAPGSGSVDNFDAAKATGAPQAAALAMGVELAKQMTPLQLAMLAALSGFVAGRRL